jgi:hypothetical protein
METEKEYFLTYQLFLLYTNLNNNEQEPLFKETSTLKNLCSYEPEFKKTLIQLIAETRDTKNGKANREKTFELFQQWIEIDEEEASQLFIYISQNYGSLNDIKYFCMKMHNINQNYYEKFIKITLHKLNHLLLNQLQNNTPNNTENISQYIPREKSKFGIFYDTLAIHWEQLTNPNNTINKQEINLQQINQYRKNYRVVLSNNPQPKNQYQKNIEQDIIDRAWTLTFFNPTTEDINNLEEEWQNFTKTQTTIENVLPIIDLTPPENGEIPWLKILGTVCRIMTKSTIKNRIVVIHQNRPIWLNLENKKLVEIIIEIKRIRQQHQTNTTNQTNLLDTIQFLFDSLVKTQISFEVVCRMTWVICSPFEIPNNTPHNITFLREILQNQILYLFLDKNENKRYVPPHIIYCNTSNKYSTKESIPTSPYLMKNTLFQAREEGFTNYQWQMITKITTNRLSIDDGLPIKTIKEILNKYEIPPIK